MTQTERLLIAKLEEFKTAILIKAGDNRLKLGIFSRPPLVDCRVIAEELYQDILIILKQQVEEEEKTVSDEEIELFYNQFGEWTKVVFPDASSQDHLRKLKDETDEAIEHPKDIMEYADCLGAIFGAAYKEGITLSQLMSAIKEKYEINKARKWEKSENGTYQHI